MAVLAALAPVLATPVTLDAQFWFAVAAFAADAQIVFRS